MSTHLCPGSARPQGRLIGLMAYPKLIALAAGADNRPKPLSTPHWWCAAQPRLLLLVLSHLRLLADHPMAVGPFRMEMAQGVRTSLSQPPERALITETVFSQFHDHSIPQQTSTRSVATHSERGPSPLDESHSDGARSRQRGHCRSPRRFALIA